MPQPNDSSYGISNPAGGLWNYPTDPDGTNLPSTVDMNVFKAGPSEEIKSNLSSSSSDSDGSDNNSSSSDSDSSCSTSEGKDSKTQTKAPQFSVTSSDCAGLRMKIAAVPRPLVVPSKNNNSLKTVKNSTVKNVHKSKSNKASGSGKNVKKLNKKTTSSSGSSCCSECSDSDSDSSSEPHSSKKKGKIKRKKANRSGSTSSGGHTDSSDTESGDDCLQEINQEDLALILPTDDVSTPGIKLPTKLSTPVNDMGSSSDTELPALVNAAIQRVESCSDSESAKIPSIQYTSSLLRDFVAKTQMLGNNSNLMSKTEIEPIEKVIEFKSEIKTESSLPTNALLNKKRRGRPKKDVPSIPSESPDSGILSTPQSPAQSPQIEKTRKLPEKSVRKQQPAKLNIANLEKSIYATERVLYPPRGRKRGPGRPAKTNVKKEDLLDPMWRKIDINKKFRRPSVSGYKSDGGNTICSKKLAAQSGYVSDYNNKPLKSSSGYRTDYSTKSRRSGYRSDFSLKAKSCGYRSDCSIRHRKKVRRKRRPKTLITKQPIVDELDILQLAGLSLGHSSEESSRDSYTPVIPSQIKPTFPTSNGIYSKNDKLNNSSLVLPTSSSKFDPKERKATKAAIEQKTIENLNKRTNGRDFLSNLCERVTKRISGLDSPRIEETTVRPTARSRKRSDGLSMLLDSLESSSKSIKAESIRSRRSSVISRCSSRSTSSRHPFRRRRRKRFKSRSRSESVFRPNEIKNCTEVDELTNSFNELCHIKKLAVQTTTQKRTTKKRKQSEHIESPSTSTTTNKRRNKKTVTTTQSPDDHKLPLKKRHYLLTEKSESVDVVERFRSHVDDAITACISKYSGTSPKNSTKAVTPKKRHLLQTPETSPEEISTVKCSSSPLTLETKTADSSDVNTKCDIMTRKKNRLEGLVSKMQPNSTTPSPEVEELPSLPTTTTTRLNNNKNSSTPLRPTVIRTPGQIPPPGVFEPTIDMELQIPATTITLPSIVTKAELLDSPRFISDEINDLDDIGVVETLLTKTAGHLQMKKKRKKINRTGFPTIKKKRKKIIEKDVVEEIKPIVVVKEVIPAKITGPINCDRVPVEGETTDIFIERNARPRLSVVSLERLQGKIPEKPIVSEQSANRQLRAKLKEKVDTLTKKRGRDLSEENSNNTSISKKLKEDQKKKGIVRDASSDNEPLINFVKVSPTKKAAIVKPRPTKPEITKTKRTEVVIPEDCLPKSRAVVKLESFTTEYIKRINERNSKNKDLKVTSKDGNLRIEEPECEKTISKKFGGKKSQKDVILRPKSRCSNRVQEKEKSKKEILVPEKKTAAKIIKAKDTILEKVEVIPVIPVIPAISEKKIIKEKLKKKDEIPETAKIIKTPTPEPAKIKKPRKSVKPVPEKEKIIEKSPENDEVHEIKPFTSDDELEHDPLPKNERITKITSRDSSPISSSSSDRSTSKKLPKKKYLLAGLFSDFYKEDDSGKSLDKIQKNPVYKPEEHPHGLLPPPKYCEKYFRQTQQDFTLPFDIYWAHENSKLIPKDVVPSWNYRKLRTNVYGDVRPNPSNDHQACSCKPESACSDDCLNRLVYTECSPENCPCGEKCQNQNIQKHIYAAGVERFMTENKGWGIRTKQEIVKGKFILEYLGEVVTEHEFKDRMATIYMKDTHHYCLHLDGGLVLDGQRMGSDCRFVNHSCSPNCDMQKWSVNGLFRMALFARRDIQPDEELTYDYNFSLFNPAEGQPCRCDTPQCRGVIGGKSQRVRPIDTTKIVAEGDGGSGGGGVTGVKSGRSRKRIAKKNCVIGSSKDGTGYASLQALTVKEKCVIRNNHCFLIRNLDKIRRLKEHRLPTTTTSAPLTLSAQISALRVPRNIRTRCVTMAEIDPEMEKTARIAGVFRELCQELSNYKDETGQMPITKLNLPSKKKFSQYYEKTIKPIDLSQIESNVEKGVYKQPKIFDEDIQRIFDNAIQFYGNDSIETAAAISLRNLYSLKKEQVFDRLTIILGSNDLLKEFLPIKENGLMIEKTDSTEDVIRCLCGLFKDEGLMIQCSKCFVWQHAECTRADTSVENYLCEKCDGRKVDLEIPMDEFTDEGYRYYLSLLRDDLHIRQTDTVYVLRDIKINPEDPNSKKHTYDTIGDIDFSECDIFRVERLWKDETGKRFVFGHHYLRPHETYHEPTRKFYPNEVVRVPLYEVVPIELVMARCWVLDAKTYCKGRPIDCIEQHVYICELRVDKGARLFSKISKHPYPLCTKNYAFRKYEKPLKIYKTYAPHDLGGKSTPKPKKKIKNEETKPISRKSSAPIVQLIPPPPKTLLDKRTRLESILTNLMSKHVKSVVEVKPPIDLSYLLTGRGARQRRANNIVTVPI